MDRVPDQVKNNAMRTVPGRHEAIIMILQQLSITLPQ